jgi:hypothetical protein
MLKKNQGTSQSIKLVGLDNYFDEMINLYESGRFPKVLLLNGKKGIGKFTLIFHFLNYLYSKKEKTSYNLSDKLINIDSKFYNSVLNNTTNEIPHFYPLKRWIMYMSEGGIALTGDLIPGCDGIWVWTGSGVSVSSWSWSSSS